MSTDTVLRDGLRRWLATPPPPRSGPLPDEQILDDLGLGGLMVGQDVGGDGGTLGDAVAVQDELGRGHAETSFLASSVMAATALNCAGTDVAKELAGLIAQGQAIGVLVPPKTWDPGHESVDRLRIHNTVAGPVLAHGQQADKPIWVLSTVRRDGVLILEGELAHAGSGGLQEIARGRDAEHAVARSLSAGKIGIAADVNGSKARALEITVEYGAQRSAFGRKVGSYQAFRHNCAESWMRIQLDRALVRAAVNEWEAASGNSYPLSTAAAVAAVESARAIGESAILLHGGIGFTWEHEVHWHVKRAAQAIVHLGGPTRQWDAVYGLMDQRTGASRRTHD